ncbi:MAG: hypothetical protein ACREJX_17920, partial [Polyangiaceae bacterium]
MSTPRALLVAGPLFVSLLVLGGCTKPKQAAAPVPFVATAVAADGTIAPREQLPGMVAPFQNVAMQSTLTEPADAVYV